MEENEVDQIISKLAIAHAKEIKIGVAEEQGWFSRNFEDSIVYV